MKDLTETEKVCKSVLEESYKLVYKIGKDGSTIDEYASEILEELSYTKISHKGVPDFIAWNSKDDYKFVEVKYSQNRLSKNQTKWISEYNNQDVEIWWFNDTDKNSYEVHEISNLVLRILPEELRKAMGWKKSDELEFSVLDSSSLELSKND